MRYLDRRLSLELLDVGVEILGQEVLGVLACGDLEGDVVLVVPLLGHEVGHVPDGGLALLEADVGALRGLKDEAAGAVEDPALHGLLVGAEEALGQDAVLLAGGGVAALEDGVLKDWRGRWCLLDGLDRSLVLAGGVGLQGPEGRRGSMLRGPCYHDMGGGGGGLSVTLMDI